MSWWENYEEEFIEMVAYYEAILERKEDLKEFFDEYKKETMYRMVFESNTIENEGLAINETKKLSLGIDNELNTSLKEAFLNLTGKADSQIKAIEFKENTSLISLVNNSLENFMNETIDFESYSTLIFQEIEKYLYKKMHNYFNDENLIFLKDSLNGKVNINYKETMKEFQITFNQIFLLTVNGSFTDLLLFLIKRAEMILQNIDINLIEFLLKEHLSQEKNEISLEEIKEFLIKIKNLSEENLRGVVCSFLSSGQYLKNMHELVANKLANNDNGEPGEYRHEAAFIDMDTTFLQASLINGAMKNLAESSFDRALQKDYNFILEACKNSALFIKIHPFGDFNGRISRLMLNNFYIMNNLPFFIVLRSNSRDKKKYIEAMKRYYGTRKIDKFLSLICKTFKKHIDEINDSLDMAGLEIIHGKILSKEEKESLKASLRFYGL